MPEMIIPDAETLRRAAEEGLASGDSAFPTMADLRAELRRRALGGDFGDDIQKGAQATKQVQNKTGR